MHDRQAEEHIEGDRAFRIAGGYRELLDLFANELRITTDHVRADALVRPVERSSTVNFRNEEAFRTPLHLNTIVRNLHWGAGGVRVEAETPHGDATFETPRVLITFRSACFKQVTCASLQNCRGRRFPPSIIS